MAEVDSSTVILSHKCITQIPTDIILRSDKVHTLNLSGNRSIRLNGLGLFKNIRKLVLQDCGLSAWPDELKDLTQLEELDVHRNRMEELNQAVSQLSRRLKKLNIGCCSFVSLPNWIGEFEQLEELDVHGNPLEELNPAISFLSPRLKKLNIRNCTLHSLPDWLGELRQLEKLDVRYNQLEEVNASIRLLSRRLKKLNIGNCGLRSLPDWLGELRQLEVLGISGNRLYALNSAISRLLQLKKLDVSFCHLTSIPESFRKLGQLREFKICGNKLSEYPSSTLHMKSLEILDLSAYPPNFPTFCLSYYLNHGSMYDLLKQVPTCENGIPECHWSMLKSMKIIAGIEMLAFQCQLSEYGALQSPALRVWRMPLIIEMCARRFKNIRSENCITKIPMEIADTNLKVLKLYGLDIHEPPAEICRQGIEAMKSYFKEKLLGAKELCPDSINMLGDVRAGKTSIAQSIVKGFPDPAADDDRTHVMQQLRARSGDHGNLFVNINDFGGHPIYHLVIPIFLPSDGLTILAYDMSLPFNDQKSTVRRWLMTVIAKLKSIRVIVAGTHSDKISSEKRKSLEKSMREFTESLLDGAKLEVKLHIKRIEERPSQCNEYKHHQLEELLCRLNSADVIVISLSCDKRGFWKSLFLKTDEGLSLLRQTVISKLRPVQFMPIRWFLVMNSILNAPADRPYRTFGEVQKLFKEQIPDADTEEHLIVILRYLTTTTQLVWLEYHIILKNFIFYSTKSILDICKNVLDHEHINRLTCHWQNSSDRKLHSEGIVREPFLKTLLQNDEVTEIATLFLKQFNLMSEQTADDGTKEYIIPSNLPAMKSEDIAKLVRKHNSCANSIVLKLSFLGSVVPMAFFETNITLMRTVATGLAPTGMSTKMWRDGLILTYEGVCFAAIHHDNLLTLAVFSETLTSCVWKILLPLVGAIRENVEASWPGATPDCQLLCPVCRRSGISEGEVGVIDTTLETLALKTTFQGKNPTCLQCLNVIPRYLSFPTPRGSLTERDKDELEAFYMKFGAVCCDAQGISTAPTDQVSTGNLRRASLDIAWKLSAEETNQISLKLWSLNLISSSEQESVDKEDRPIEKATTLLKILQKKEAEHIKEFEKILRELKREELANLVIGRNFN